MSSSVRKVLDEIHRLPEEDRDLIRAELEESDDSASEEVEQAWQDEIARRVRSIQDGTAVLHDQDEVMRELDEIVKR